MPMAISNIAIDSLPTLQISLGIVALLENIYDGEPIFTIFSVKLSVWSEKCVTETGLAFNLPLFSLVNTFTER